MLVPLAGCLVGLMAGVSPADRPSVQWHWSRLPGAETCPSGGALAADIADRLGYQPFGDPASLFLEAVVDRRPSGWRVRLFARDADGALQGSRVLEADGPDCGVVTDAVVLAAVLSIDPEALTRGPAPPPPPPPPSPPPAVRRPAPAPPRRAGSARLLTQLSVGTLPRVTPGWALALDQPLVGRWSAGAGFGLLVAQRAEAVDVGLAAGWLEGCWGPGGPTLRVNACLRAYAGALRVAVRAAPERVPVDPGQFLWVATAPAAGFYWRPAGRLVLVVDVAAPVSLTRQSFRIDGEEVFREAPVALIASLAVGVAI